MSDNFKQVVEYLNDRTPQSRLARHKVFWGDAPAPDIAARLQAIERLLVDGKASEKVLLMLKELDRQRTIVEWNTDPDTILGEKERGRQSARGKLSAEVRAKNAPRGRAELNSIVEKLAKRRDALGDYIPPSELWEPLYSEMDAEGLRPRESIDKVAYTYAAGAEYTFDAFKGQLRRIRNKIKK
ncbi:MAG: hypothetical protein WCY72_01515 [Lysobacteraceae bacterium]